MYKFSQILNFLQNRVGVICEIFNYGTLKYAIHTLVKI